MIYIKKIKYAFDELILYINNIEYTQEIIQL